MRVTLITRREVAKGVLARWLRQYLHGNEWGQPWAQEIHDKIKALGNAPSPDDVDTAIGNSWTRITCDSCERDVEQAVQFGSNEDTSSFATLCHDCAIEASVILQSGDPKEEVERLRAALEDIAAMGAQESEQCAADLAQRALDNAPTP